MTKKNYRIFLSALAVSGFLTALGLLAAPPFTAPLGSIDPWVYTGLAFDYDQLVDRFGPTYYASRVVHIFFVHFFDKFFGQPFGVILLKFAIICSSSCAAYLWALRKFESHEISLCLSAICSWTPYLAGHWLGDHYDLTATSFLILASLFGIWPRRETKITQLIGGLCLAFAANTNQFTLAVYFVMIPGFLLLLLSQQQKLFLFFLFTAVGFLTGSLFTQAALWYAHPVWRENALVVIQTIRSLIGGGMADWYVSTGEAFRLKYFYVITPLSIGLIALILSKLSLFAKMDADTQSKKSKELVGAGLIGILPTIFFLLFSEFLKSGILTREYYLIYLFPGILIPTGFVLNHIKKCSVLNITSLRLFVFGCFTLWFIGAPTTNFLFNSINFGSLLFCTLFLIALFIFSKKPALSCLAVVGCLLLYIYLPFSIKRGERPFEIEWICRHEVKSLLNTVKKSAPVRDGKIGFWYEKENKYLYSLQSSFLWGYSLISDEKSPFPQNLLKASQENKAGIFILDTDNNKLGQKIEKLKDAAFSEGYYVEIISRRKLDEIVGKACYAYLKIKKASKP